MHKAESKLISDHIKKEKSSKQSNELDQVDKDKEDYEAELNKISEIIVEEHTFEDGGLIEEEIKADFQEEEEEKKEP